LRTWTTEAREFEVDLLWTMPAPAGRRGSCGRPSGPAQEGIALTVALVFASTLIRKASGVAVGVDLDGVVNHEVNEEVGVDALRVAALAGHLVAEGGRRSGDDGDTGEVLQENAGGQEGEFAVGDRGTAPAASVRTLSSVTTWRPRGEGGFRGRCG